jgi:hypothetical protein
MRGPGRGLRFLALKLTAHSGIPSASIPPSGERVASMPRTRSHFAIRPFLAESDWTDHVLSASFRIRTVSRSSAVRRGRSGLAALFGLAVAISGVVVLSVVTIRHPSQWPGDAGGGPGLVSQLQRLGAFALTPSFN